LSLALSRPFSAASARLSGAGLSLEGGLGLWADRIEIASLAPRSLELRVESASASWPEAEALPPAAPSLAGKALAAANLAPLALRLSLQAAFDQEAGSFSATVSDLQLADGLASGALAAEFTGLTPAAVEALGLLSPKTAALAAKEPALFEAGLSRLALDWQDSGLTFRLASGQADLLDLPPLSASDRLADALELYLTIRLDPFLSNLKALSDLARAHLAAPGRLAVRAAPDPPLSAARYLALLGREPLGADAMGEVAVGEEDLPPDTLGQIGASLGLTLALGEAAPVAARFRAEAAFDRPFTGEDSSLHPRP
jgi:hypothetical protein